MLEIVLFLLVIIGGAITFAVAAGLFIGIAARIADWVSGF